MWCPWFLLISPLCFSSSLNRFGVLVASLSFWSLLFFFMSRTFLDCCCSLSFQGFLLLCSLSVAILAFPSTLLHMLASHVKHEDWHNCWKIFYVHCFKPFSRRNQGKKEKRHQSASVDSHSDPVFFCLVCFLSLLLFLCCRVYPVGGSTKTNPEHGEKEYWPTICLESLKLPYIYIYIYVTPYSECNFHIPCGGNPGMSFWIYFPYSKCNSLILNILCVSRLLYIYIRINHNASPTWNDRPRP